MKLMNKGFRTTLNGNNGLSVEATSDGAEAYGGVFKNFGNGDVRFAHSSGMMIDSHTKAKTGFNARCSHLLHGLLCFASLSNLS